MTRSIQEKSIDGATGTTTGSILNTGGRVTVSLFVVTDTDPGTLDVQIDVSMDGENFTSFSDDTGNQRLLVDAADFEDPDGNGEFAAFVTSHGVAARHVRARIVNYTSGGNVEAWVSASSNPDTAKDYREVP